MKSGVSINSWEDVNKALKLKGECELTLDTLEAEMNMKINDVKLETEKLSKPLKEKVKELEEQIKDFTEENKTEIEGRTKILTFGKVGFRLSSNVSVPTKKLSKIIENLRKFGMENCIKVSESVNKDILGTYSDKDIAKVGATKKAEDKFWCEADKERIRG